MARRLTKGQYGAHQLCIGDSIYCGKVLIKSEIILSFAELSGDQFEIHMSDEGAKAHGFDRQVAHGLLILSLVDGMKNNAPAQLKARASRKWNWSFKAPVFKGDTISALFIITNIAQARQPDQRVITLEFTVQNQDGIDVQTGWNSLLCYN
jgi:3-hydroxybutyryl-CoA dehydratase